MARTPLAKTPVPDFFTPQAGAPWRFPIPAKAIVITYLVVYLAWLLVVERRYASTPMDELFALLMVPAAAAGIVVYWRSNLVIVILFAIYAVIGMTSQISAHVGGIAQPRAAITDILLDAKMFIIYLGFYFLIRRERYREETFVTFAWWLIGIALINGVFVLRDVFFGHGYGLYGQPLIPRAGSYQPQGLVFHHLESCYLSMIAALAALALYRIRRTWTLLFLSLLLGLIFVVHLSAKELMAYFLCVVLFFMGQRGRTPVWVFTLPLAVIVVVLIVFLTPIGQVFFGQYDQYIGSNSGLQVRSVMTNASFDIAWNHFPLGAGAGTFASPPSIQSGYSDLYYQYGLAKMWGATPDKPNFVLDVFWPKVLAETGWLGFVAYAAILLVVAAPLIRWFAATRGAVAWFCLSINLATAIMSIAATPYNNEYLSIVWAFSAALGAVGYSQEIGGRGRRFIAARSMTART